MAKFTFSAESDDLTEIAALINAATGGAVSHGAVAAAIAKPLAPEKVAEAPRPARKTKAREEAPAPVEESTTTGATTAPAESASEAPPADTDEHPMLRNYSHADIKDKAGEMMKKDPKIGAKIITELEAKFGCRKFGDIQDEDLNRAMAMLESLEG